MQHLPERCEYVKSSCEAGQHGTLCPAKPSRLATEGEAAQSMTLGQLSSAPVKTSTPPSWRLTTKTRYLPKWEILTSCPSSTRQVRGAAQRASSQPWLILPSIVSRVFFFVPTGLPTGFPPSLSPFVRQCVLARRGGEKKTPTASDLHMYVACRSGGGGGGLCKSAGCGR